MTEEPAKDLFGDPVPPPNNRGGKRKSPLPKGYVAMPGTGPAGETCGSCKYLVRKMMAKTYLKCGLNKARWTGGGGSDVRARSPACSKWEKPE